MSTKNKLEAIHKNIKACRLCPKMCGTPVHGAPIATEIMLVGQAPGPHEEKFGKPFAYTAGKTLFKWFGEIGIDEEAFRDNIYITATARCFPGKEGKGDRVPSKKEIDSCSSHLSQEVGALRPKLIIAVGRLAIGEVLGRESFSLKTKLSGVVGKKWKSVFHGHECDVVCLPHPSGLSRWPHSKEGQEKLKASLKLIRNHPAWIKRFHSYM